MSVSDGDDLD
jgi:hypothetical protein